MPTEEAQIREEQLHEFWLRSEYFTFPLKTRENHVIEVIRRGERNFDAGPDFKNAVLKIDGRVLQGDVEIHLDARDWYNHGHHLDPAYNGVVLHLALGFEKASESLRLENGTVIPAVFLAPALLKKPARAQTVLPLLDCPLSRESEAKIIATVQAAGEQRFDQRLAILREQIGGMSWDQLVYRGVCDALGYSKNRQPFLKLADRLPIDVLFGELRQTRESPEVLVSALFFGVGGLLSRTGLSGPMDGEIRAYLAPRQRLWAEACHLMQLQPLHPGEWQFFRLRPQNFPTRRLAALTQIVLKFYQVGILESLLQTISESATRPVATTIRELRRFFIVPADDFWSRHFDLSGRSASGFKQPAGHLLGKSRADDLVVNVILPILGLFAVETGQGVLRNRVEEIYAAFPSLQENSHTRAMRRQLFADRRGAAGGQKSARFQQGLLHLEKNYCSPLRCEECLCLTPPAVRVERGN